jgi:hypothetical protein
LSAALTATLTEPETEDPLAGLVMLTVGSVLSSENARIGPS